MKERKMEFIPLECSKCKEKEHAWFPFGSYSSNGVDHVMYNPTDIVGLVHFLCGTILSVNTNGMVVNEEKIC